MTEKEFTAWLNSITFNIKEDTMAEVNSIDWHRECLCNSRKYALKLAEEMNRLKKEIEKLDSENAFRLHQIRKAVEQGKTHFDAERFGRSRKKKEKCGLCGAAKPQDQSCICFDNHCQ